MRARRIVHREVSERLRSPEPDPRFEGLFLVFWHRGRPIGHRDVLCRDLPLSAHDVEALRSAAAAASPPPPPSLERAAAATVVVCTRDRTASLAACLRSFRDLAHPPGEIVVVDNAPGGDGTRRLVETWPGVRYVLEPRPGLDRARNAGVRASRGAFVAFADDDVTVDPDWLGRLLAGFDDPRVMGVTGLVLPGELDTPAQLAFETHWGFGRGYEPRVFDEGWFARVRRRGAPVWEIGAGASMAFRREAFALVGEFDERLDAGQAGCCGDSELWYRLLAAGWRCRYEPSAVTYHRHRRDDGALARQLHAYMRGHVTALLVQFERHRHWGNLRRLTLTLPADYARTLVDGVLRGFGPRHRTLGAEVRGCLAGVRFYARTRGTRAPLGAGREAIGHAS
jgi:GT2 family glycosyltransferase